MSLAFSPDGKRLATGGLEKTVKVWDLETGQEALTLRGHEDVVMAVAFSPDGQQLASASMDRTVKVWDADALGPSRPRSAHPARPRRRGHRRGLPARRRSPRLGQLPTRRCGSGTRRPARKSDPSRARRPVADVAFSRDGRRLATADFAGVVKVWDAATGQEVRTFRGSPGPWRSAPTAGAWPRPRGAPVHIWDADDGQGS